MEKKIKTEDKEIKAPLNTDLSSQVSNSVHSPVATILSVNTSYSNYDPIAEKLKELEKRIDAWQNKFEFVDVRKK